MAGQGLWPPEVLIQHPGDKQMLLFSTRAMRSKGQEALGVEDQGKLSRGGDV